jgi:ATP-dependent Clp protease adaptor protein ClpS
MPKHNPQADRETTTLERIKVAEPRLYEVVLHNDDYTTQVFVVYVLMKFFHHDSTTANEIMLHVHTKGSGVAGLYSRDIAETKASQVTGFARKHEMPLECSVRRQSC